MANITGLSDAVEKKVLDHLTGKAAYTSPAPLYLALCTAVPQDSDSGATLSEATYTGYARKQVPAADWNAASGLAAAVTTAVQEQFAACTAGSSTIIGWALVASASGAGDVVTGGTCATTVVSTTQTPATVPAGGISVSLD